MEHGSVLGGMAMIIRAMDGSEFGYLMLAMTIPWVLIAWALYRLREEVKKKEISDRERFEGVVKMYENNVLLVSNYEKTADGLHTVIHISTKAITRLVEKINNNHFCPIVRERSLPDGEQDDRPDAHPPRPARD